MQDCAPPHIARQVTAQLRAHFGDELANSRPPRSMDLNRCDFWLWRFLTDHFYRGNIQTVLELKASITRHISSTDRETLRIIRTITRF